MIATTVLINFLGVWKFQARCIGNGRPEKHIALTCVYVLLGKIILVVIHQSPLAILAYNYF